VISVAGASRFPQVDIALKAGHPLANPKAERLTADEAPRKLFYMIVVRPII
jgi:hypothetical protein